MHISVFQQTKLYLMAHLHLAKDALHIYVGLLVFFGVMLLFGWRARQWKPWLAVLIVALAGELWDLIDATAYLSHPDYWGHWHDIWNTLFWPSAIMLLARFTRVFRKGS